MKKMMMLLAICVMFMSGSFGKTLMKASAEVNETNTPQKYYTNIEVKAGESLWSIAEEYCPNSGMSIREYIYELKKMNRLTSDTIQAGECLTIVYVADKAV